ncbi:basic transcription factor 3 [Canna indica]|uniref:Nascent polypeptide-associated complex subunit beta n=1 Tax=Canna indica TaxID=4628 RepID=A0AAQ3QE91_9LILI|nr:basic transcription factor 3 [Canna indica]
MRFVPTFQVGQDWDGRDVPTRAHIFVPVRPNFERGRDLSRLYGSGRTRTVGTSRPCLRCRRSLLFAVACALFLIMNREKLMKMAGAVRTGGKGSMRRKKKAVHKTPTTDDKRLQSTLKRIGVNAIPGIEEVNIFKDDTVTQFVNPKVQASITANTWVVSGSPQTKKLQDMLPSIINQLGPDNLENLRRLAEQFQKQASGANAAAAKGDEEEEDDVPELVPGETFEEVAEEKQAS